MKSIIKSKNCFTGSVHLSLLEVGSCLVVVSIALLHTRPEHAWLSGQSAGRRMGVQRDSLQSFEYWPVYSGSHSRQSAFATGGIDSFGSFQFGSRSGLWLEVFRCLQAHTPGNDWRSIKAHLPGSSLQRNMTLDGGARNCDLPG